MDQTSERWKNMLIKVEILPLVKCLIIWIISQMMMSNVDLQGIKYFFLMSWGLLETLYGQSAVHFFL